MEGGCFRYMEIVQVADEILFTVELEGTEEFVDFLKHVDIGLSGPRLVEAWEAAVGLVAEKVRETAPRDLGYLAAGIGEEVTQDGEDLLGIIFSDTFYAPFQERGTYRYFPNIDALEEWAERHGTTAYVVALAIARRGIIPLRFFEDALINSEDQVVSLIGRVTGEIIEQGY